MYVQLSTYLLNLWMVSHFELLFHLYMFVYVKSSQSTFLCDTRTLHWRADDSWQSMSLSTFYTPANTQASCSCSFSCLVLTLIIRLKHQCTVATECDQTPNWQIGEPKAHCRLEVAPLWPLVLASSATIKCKALEDKRGLGVTKKPWKKQPNFSAVCSNYHPCQIQ